MMTELNLVEYEDMSADTSLPQYIDRILVHVTMIDRIINGLDDDHPGAFPGPQRQDYFEAPGKPPSPGPECEGPYRSPQPYRTSYYGQECDKY